MFSFLFILIYMTRNEIYKMAAKELGMPVDTVKNIYEGYFRTIREMIASLPLRCDMTEEEFNKYKISFNVPYLGKIYIDYKMLKSEKFLQEKRKKENDKD